MKLEISRAALDAIRADAAANPDAEVCGLLLGKGLRVMEIRPCRNVAHRPETEFEIDPQALIAAYKAARTGGPAVIGHYHSHPTGRAEPSARDAAAARGGEVWVIVRDRDVMAWMASSQGGFDALAISTGASPANAGVQ